MTYKVTIKTVTESVTYDATGNLDSIVEAAFDTFAICAVTVMVQP